METYLSLLDLTPDLELSAIKVNQWRLKNKGIGCIKVNLKQFRDDYYIVLRSQQINRDSLLSNLNKISLSKQKNNMTLGYFDKM